MVRLWHRRLKLASVSSLIRLSIGGLSSKNTVHPSIRRLGTSSTWFLDILALAGGLNMRTVLQTDVFVPSPIRMEICHAWTLPACRASLAPDLLAHCASLCSNHACVSRRP
ncbi:hypothetical protein HAX54_013344 [Datura stramonium]|uniref:Uncharacterized protein n=1 Tax=Datura stramonium TaxID=4076 RepID=A0ABS8TL92_DATST|nr:hypothetical protein [Datura stramonium]